MKLQVRSFKHNEDEAAIIFYLKEKSTKIYKVGVFYKSDYIYMDDELLENAEIMAYVFLILEKYCISNKTIAKDPYIKLARRVISRVGKILVKAVKELEKYLKINCLNE